MLSSILTSALDRDDNLHAPAVLPRGKYSAVAVGWKAGWAQSLSGRCEGRPCPFLRVGEYISASVFYVFLFSV
jgi:hypothetical protein